MINWKQINYWGYFELLKSTALELQLEFSIRRLKVTLRHPGSSKQILGSMQHTAGDIGWADLSEIKSEHAPKNPTVPVWQ